MQTVEKIFTKIGGKFLTQAVDIKEKLEQIKAYLFDWDGVFNDGIKGEQLSSPFTEADAMGINLLRFGHWLLHKEMPFVAIVTGMKNEHAFHFATRENIACIYFKFLHKIEALEHIQLTVGIAPSQVAFIYDDALDLSAARRCGLRFLVRRSASPLFVKYAKDHQLCDYITAHSGHEHAVREVCELLLGLSGQYESSLTNRMNYSDGYQQYLAERKAIVTSFYIKQNEFIEKLTHTSKIKDETAKC